jgi:hypothetical protein
MTGDGTSSAHKKVMKEKSAFFRGSHHGLLALEELKCRCVQLVLLAKYGVWHVRDHVVISGM